MTDAQWHCIHAFLGTCPDIRVGKETHCRLFVEAARGRARMGAPLAPVARQVRPGELGLSPLGPRVRPGRLAAPDSLPAGRSGSVRRAAGQHPRARARERGGAPPNPGTDHALGRSRGGFGTQIHILADRRGRPLRVTGGPRHART